MKVTYLTSFSDFGLAEPLNRALATAQHITPTPIQIQTIPLAMAGRDIVGIAQTGTGKTAAFALPILNRLAANPYRPEKKACRVLVLSPTRELSGQIVESFKTYGKNIRLSSTLAIGGVPINKQRNALAMGVDILVATPGRLLDLLQSKAVRLDWVEVFVLDEADRMLDMGFIHDIRKIVNFLPAKRQTLFFSATMPAEIASLANLMLTNPAKVAVSPAATTVERIDQRVIHVDRGAKPDMLNSLLANPEIDRALIFTRTKHGADKVVRSLAKAGVSADAIHGNKSQPQRERALAAFRAGKVRTLVATDIAARGIDVTGISHVINFDLPNIPESYVHRIGRTARAGRDGVAISLCSRDELPFLRDIQKLIRLEIPASGEQLPAGRVDREAGEAAPRAKGRRGGGQRSGNGHRGGGHRPAQHERDVANGAKAPQQQAGRAASGQHADGEKRNEAGTKPRRRRFWGRGKPGSPHRKPGGSRMAASAS